METEKLLKSSQEKTFSSEKAKKRFANQTLAKILAAGAVTTAAIVGPHPVQSHEQTHPQNPRVTQSAEATLFPATSETQPLADNLNDQSEQQAKQAEQHRKAVEQQRKEAEQHKKEVARRKEGTEQKVIDALANKADKDSPTPKRDLKKNIALIVDSLKEEKIATPRVIAYAMATMETETGHTYEPVREGYYLDKANGDKPGTNGEKTAEQNGYDGGKNYYGRGYVQITHKYNYEKFDRELGMKGKLANNPDQALKPNVAGDILATFFKENGVAKKAKTNFVAARQPVNGTDKAQEIANDANKYLQAIKSA
jgi:predicted chitinase